MAILPTQVEVETEPQTQTASRSQVYQLLADAFCFPTPEVFEQIRTGSIWDTLRAITPGLPYAFPIEETPAGALELNFEEFQSQYIGLFEVGQGSAPPCPLYEGSYWGGRTAVMAELLAFYHYFGLRPLQQQPHELPDHLSLELEFMHALTFKEVVASGEGKSLEPYVKAEHDFLERHLVEFVSTLNSHLGRLKMAFFSPMMAMAEQFCQRDLAYVAERLAKR